MRSDSGRPSRLLGALAGLLLLPACTQTQTGSALPGLQPMTTASADPFSEIPTGAIFLPLGSWRPSSTGRDRALSPCLRRSLGVGAEAHRVRAFTGTRSENLVAQDVVATYHDEAAAQRGLAILTGWYKTCAAQLGGSGSWRGTPIRSLGPGDDAAWFAVVRNDRMRWTTGVVRVGTVVGMVTIRNDLASTRFDPETKMTAMLRRAAGRL